MVGSLHPIKTDRHVYIAATVRMRSSDPRVEQYHPVTRLIRLRLLTDEVGTDYGGYGNALLRVIEFGNNDHEWIVDRPPLTVLDQMHLVDTEGEIHSVSGDRIAH